MEQNGKIVFAAFADWASSRLTKSSNEAIQSVLHGTKK
ncbi:hypothetical protein LEP1GSC161_0283 [Leptospira santarosai str. CBC1416]|uniref:Uncharacterized protein n=1 Tax=Leptospira santarosai str. CBC1416 TaxID=1193059 RepID=M6VX66_9LEPT|nr:hypothetical protein LEP1GSC161_0283 [Leptospira santarosai str. CBC1416]